MLRQIRIKSVLTGQDMPQTLDDHCGLRSPLVVRSVFGDGRIFDCVPTRHVDISIRCCRGNVEFIGQIVTDSYDDNPVPCLWNAVLLELVQIGIQAVARAPHRLKNYFYRLSLVCALQAADILRKKPLRLFVLQDFHAVRVERTERAVKALLLADNAEVVAGEAERECVDVPNLIQLVKVQIADIRADDRFPPVRADIARVCGAGISVIIICPLMRYAEFGVLNAGSYRTFCDSARSAEQFT